MGALSFLVVLTPFRDPEIPRGTRAIRAKEVPNPWQDAISLLSVFIPGLSQLSCDDIHQQPHHQLPCMRDGSMPQGELVYQMR